MNNRRFWALILSISMLFSLLCFEGTVSVGAAEKQEGVMIDLSTVWKYLDDGSDPSDGTNRTSWTSASFNDSKWKTSKGHTAKFGAQTGKLATFSDGTKIEVLLNQYKSNGENIPTYFFRTEFTLDKLPASGTTAVGTVSYDDAVIVYINGTKVASYYEPKGGFATNLSYGGSGLGTPLTDSFTFDTSILKQGKNVVAVELHQANKTSSDVYFDMSRLAIGVGGQSSIVMNVGKNESERNITWRFPSGNGRVEYAIKNGEDFPTEFETAKATYANEGTTFIYRATMKNPHPDSTYVYRLVNGDSVSEIYTFKTDPADEFNFIFVGDAQIGASGNVGTDSANWKVTLNTATEMFPETSLLISGGDQVDSAGYDPQFAGFLSPSQMTSLALAPTVGNHDSYENGFSRYFSVPNKSISGYLYGATAAGGDYWYTYNNTLFIHLNDNNLSAAEHKVVIDHAIKQSPDVTWKIIVMHQSMFSGGGNHVKDPLILTRSQLVPLFVQYDIDVVLSGHDHVYSRSYIMSDGFTANKSSAKSVKNPEGVLYLTGGSSSGSKYYGMLDSALVPHSAITIKNKMAFTNIEITETSFKLTTYASTSKEVIDSFEIIKDTPKEKKQNIAYEEPYTAPAATKDTNAFLNDGMAIALYENEKNWYSVSDLTNAYDGVANIEFDFDTLYDISKVRIHLLSGTTAKLLLEKYGTPEAIELYTSVDGKSFEKFGSFDVLAATTTPTAYWTELETNGLTARYVRVSIVLPRNVRVLLNEIEVIGAVNKNSSETDSEEPRENVALNKSYESTAVNTSYPDEGNKTLTDGVRTDAKTAYDNASWMAFNKNDPAYKENGYAYVTLDLGGIHYVDGVSAYIASRLQGAGIKVPDSFEVYVSDDKNEWELVGSCIPYDTLEAKMTVETVNFGSPVKTRYIQYRFFAEKSNWIMISELEAYGIKECSTRGDVNSNGLLEKYDYILVKRAIINTIELNEAQQEAADVNENGSVEKYDYIVLKRKIA